MNAMTEETTEYSLTLGVTLEEAMNSWIFQGGYPVITVIRNYENKSITVYQVTIPNTILSIDSYLNKMCILNNTLMEL